MLDKEQLQGPTVAEFVASELTAEAAEALRRSITVQADGSIKIDFTGPPETVAATALFLTRCGVSVRHVPARIAVDELVEHLWEVLTSVARDVRPVEVDVDGDIVHVSPGPAASEPIDLRALAARARSASRRSRRSHA